MLLIPSKDFFIDELLPNSNRIGPGGGSLGPCHNFRGLALLECPTGDAKRVVGCAVGLLVLLGGSVEVRCCMGGLSARGSEVDAPRRSDRSGDRDTPCKFFLAE